MAVPMVISKNHSAFFGFPSVFIIFSEYRDGLGIAQANLALLPAFTIFANVVVKAATTVFFMPGKAYFYASGAFLVKTTIWNFRYRLSIRTPKPASG